MMGMNTGMMNPNMMMGMNTGMMNPNMMMGMNSGMMNPNMMMMNPNMMMMMQRQQMMMQQQGMQPGMQANPQLQKQLNVTQVPQQMMMQSAMQTNPQLNTTQMNPLAPPTSPAPTNPMNTTQQQPGGAVAPVGVVRAPSPVQRTSPSPVRRASPPLRRASPPVQARIPSPAGAEEDEDEIPGKKKKATKLVPFKLQATIQGADEWSERLRTFPSYDWNRSPIRLIPLSQKHEATAEELLASRSGKIIEFGESIREGSDDSFYNLDFGFAGIQVPVEQDLKQKFMLATAESQRISFKIIRRKYPKYRVSFEPAEGTLSKSAVMISATLRMACTTSAELEIPILCWHGTLKDYERVLTEPSGDKQVFVCYLRGKIQSQLSTRLDIEEVQLFKPAIGNGAFGTVYKGRYRGLDVACKLLKDQDDLTQAMFDDFKSEVNMFETLRHPCIVNFVGAVWFPGSLALVTELCQYGSLPSAMAKYGPTVYTPEMKIKALFDCARAMDFLHQSSIIHRDLKPDNLLATSLEVHSPAVCKLSDFGTTKGANSMMREMNMTKGIGTPLYMAPEMMRGIEGYTTKADVYSFGIMMASVTDDGKEPYENDPTIQNSWQFTNQVIQGHRPTVANEGTMPPEFIELMKKCWDGDPAVRPSFESIVAELECMLPE